MRSYQPTSTLTWDSLTEPLPGFFLLLALGILLFMLWSMRENVIAFFRHFEGCEWLINQRWWAVSLLVGFVMFTYGCWGFYRTEIDHPDKAIHTLWKIAHEEMTWSSILLVGGVLITWIWFLDRIASNQSSLTKKGE